MPYFSFLSRQQLDLGWWLYGHTSEEDWTSPGIIAMIDRKKPGWAFWATVVVLSPPFLYVLSFGPACWLVQNDVAPGFTYRFLPVYKPLVSRAIRDDSATSRALNWYSGDGLLALELEIEKQSDEYNCFPNGIDSL
jgi:hypothetical protein